MKKLTKMLLPLVALFALTGCDDGLTPATPSTTPSAEPSSVAPAKSIDTKDGKRYAVAQTETYSLKDNLVLTGFTFEELEVKLSNDVAEYANGVLTRKKYGTVTATIGEAGSIFGINLNVTFLPENAFHATYEGSGTGDAYANMKVKVQLTSEKNAKITYSGTYKNDAGADVEVAEKILEGAYAEKSYGESVSSNLLIYVVNVAGLEDKPQFSFIGADEGRSISIRIGKLPLATDLTFSANCAMALK